MYVNERYAAERICTLRRLRRPVGLEAEERRFEAAHKLANKIEPKLRADTSLDDLTVCFVSQLFEPLNEVLREGPIPFPDLRGIRSLSRSSTTSAQSWTQLMSSRFSKT